MDTGVEFFGCIRRVELKGTRAMLVSVYKLEPIAGLVCDIFLQGEIVLQ